MPKPAKNFALFIVEDSPIGLTYLRAMIAHKIPPAFVLVSHQPKITELAQKTVKERSKGTFTYPTMIELLANQNIPVYYTNSHNSAFTIELIKRYKIDVGILGGTGIIKQPTIDAPRLGIVNVHPSLLPEYRGCSAVEWAIYEHRPVGATCHFITTEIDVGDIVTRGTLRIQKGDLYHDVRRKAYELQPTVLIKGLQVLLKDGFEKKLKKNEGGKYYDTMQPKDVKKIKAILQNGEYKLYV